MEIRLQKAFSEYGIMSRRACEKLINEGKIYVNGVMAQPGCKVDPDTDIVEVNGQRVCFSPPKAAYIMMNKPKGYITSVIDEKGRKTVMDLLPPSLGRVYPVGRLDYNSEGLLILTNDGDFANAILHPSFNKNKTYIVRVTGYYPGVEKDLSEPMVIDGYTISPATVKVIYRSGPAAELEIIIHEGRNRQIRKMCAACDLTVKSLIRTAIGTLKLGPLESGKWRYMTGDEVKSLYDAR